MGAVRAVSSLFVVSGALAVLDEVALARLLGLYVGHAATAHALVIGCFLGGMGLGYGLGGGVADRSSRPLRLYGLLEAFAGVWCLGTPEALAALAAPSNASLTSATLRACLCACVLLPPSVAMGMTLPALIRWLSVRSKGDSGELATAQLYGLNSLGAVIGGLISGLWSVETLGVRGTLWLGGGAACLVAAVATLLDGLGAPLEPTPARRTPHPRASRLPLFSRLSWAAAMAGWAALVAQTLWLRVFGLVLGTSSYTFCLVVAGVIAGVAIGAAWVHRALFHVEPTDRRALGLTLSRRFALAGGLLLVLGGVTFERLPWVVAAMRSWWPQLSFEGWTALQACLVWCVVLPPSAALGAVLPALTAAQTWPDTPATSAGALFASNTLGGVLGAALGGLIMLPALGISATLSLAVGALMVSGWMVDRSADLRMWLTSVATLVVCVTSLGSLDVRLLSAGVFRRGARDPGTWAAWKHRLQRERAVFARHGPDATVAVLERRGHRVLKINGKPDASTRGDMLTQVASAWLPFAFSHGADRALVIGLGSGVTAGEADRLFGQVEVVEISPAVIAAARHFGAWNRDVSARVAIHRHDARAWLQGDLRRWDVVISEPSNPWVAGNGALFTREFFHLVRSKLSHGGVLAQWFHFYEMDEPLLRLVLRTVQSEFRYVSLWTLFPGDLLMLASDEPLRPRQNRLARAFKRDGGSLERLDVTSIESLLSLQAMPASRLRERLDLSAALHEDDLPVLEFRAPRALFGRSRCELIETWDQRDALAAREPMQLSVLRSMTRLHVRFPASPSPYREELLRQLATREREPKGLVELAFTLARTGPDDAAMTAMRRLEGAEASSASGLRALAMLQRRLGRDPKPSLLACIRVGDPGGRCLRLWREAEADRR